MKICTTTQTHAAADIVGDALRSTANFADAHLLFTSAGCDDHTVAVARATVGDKLVVVPFDWGDDFSTARNFHLEEAARRGFDWAVTLDTDERLAIQRHQMADTDADVLLVRHNDGSYMKQRCFRLPCRGRWKMPVHEQFVSGDCKQAVTDGAWFFELLKTVEANDAKLERCRDVLEDYTLHNCTDSTAWYYLGDTYSRLNNVVHAVRSFRECFNLNEIGEEGAWSMYRAAECEMRKERWNSALECCVDGMTRHPGMAELSCTAAYCCHKMGRHHDAVCWGMTATMFGNYEGIGSHMQLTGFRHLPCLYELPYDVMRWAWRAMGDDRRAEACDAHHKRALDARNAALNTATVLFNRA